MTINKLYKFTEVFEVETFLNGGVIGGEVKGAMTGTPAGLNCGIPGLIGKTLKFTSPGAITATFAAPTGVGGSAEPGVGTNPDPTVLLFKDIKLQVEAASALLKVFSINGRIVIREATATSGIAIDPTGTASRLLGFDGTVATVGKLFNAPPSAVVPCWTWAYCDSNNMHCIYTRE
jgi:hypothetical protein